MPAPLAVDREAVRVLVVAVGVREAAARMKLPVGTVAAWSARGDWLAGVVLPERAISHQAAMQSAVQGAITPEKAMLAKLLPEHLRPTIPREHAISGAITAPEALQDAMADLSRRGKLATLRAGVRVVEHLANPEQPVEVVIAEGPNAKAWVGSMATAGGWTDTSTGTTRINIYASAARIEGESGPVIDV